jgi:hypothetical protein
MNDLYERRYGVHGERTCINKYIVLSRKKSDYPVYLFTAETKLLTEVSHTVDNHAAWSPVFFKFISLNIEHTMKYLRYKQAKLACLREIYILSCV